MENLWTDRNIAVVEGGFDNGPFIKGVSKPSLSVRVFHVSLKEWPRVTTLVHLVFFVTPFAPVGVLTLPILHGFQVREDPCVDQVES